MLRSPEKSSPLFQQAQIIMSVPGTSAEKHSTCLRSENMLNCLEIHCNWQAVYLFDTGDVATGEKWILHL